MAPVRHRVCSPRHAMHRSHPSLALRALLAHVRVGVVLALVLGLAGKALALDPSKSLIQFPHRTWQTTDGLPQNSVLALAQTPDGYLWGGTWEGLVRFDGVRFTVFDKNNTPALPGSSVHCLERAPDGMLWIGTNEGLASWRRGAFLPISPPPGTSLED